MKLDTARKKERKELYIFAENVSLTYLLFADGGDVLPAGVL